VTITVTATEPPPSKLKFKGFFQPVHNLPAVNGVKAGTAVPVRFSVEGTLESVLQPGSPTSVPAVCSAGVADKPIAGTVKGGASGPGAVGNMHTYLWKTSADWAGTCRRLVVTLVDGSRHEALFRFTKHPKVLPRPKAPVMRKNRM
jgi:hypothetical protein